MFCLPLTGLTQSDFQKKHQIQASTTFSIGLMRDNVQNAYLHGFLNYFPEENVSLRGDGYYFFNSLSELKPLASNHQVYAGGFYHFKSAKIDPYVGFQPGIAISSRTDTIQSFDPTFTEPSGTSVNPLTSFVAGFNYFGGKHFSLFVETRYTRGIHLSNSWPKYLDELRFSFGLAFQVGTRKVSSQSAPKAIDSGDGG